MGFPKSQDLCAGVGRERRVPEAQAWKGGAEFVRLRKPSPPSSLRHKMAARGAPLFPV